MARRLILLGLLVGAFGASNAYALPMVTVNWAPNHSPSGGEFILTTTNIGTFNSFCIEEDEFVSIGGTYYYSTSNAANQGGNNVPPDPSPDPISRGTAWLYSQFSAGLLPGYLSTAAQQNDLQNAFWMLEGELAVAANPWITLVQGAIGGDIYADANGAYGVGVMNLWTNADGTGFAQDMLYRTPDGGTTLSLLGLAMFGVSIVSRRIRRA